MQSDTVKDNIKDIQKDSFLSDRKSFIILKIERIAIASYLVTDFLFNDEPLKWKIRSTAAEIVTTRLSQLIDPLSRLSTLFSIAAEARLGSAKNFSTLAGECETLKSTLIDEEGKVVSIGALERLNKEDRATTPLYKGHKKELGSRADAILSILKERGESSIGAVAAQLPTVSEKTVQRELTALVERGVVEKRGERRWSRYRIPGSN